MSDKRVFLWSHSIHTAAMRFASTVRASSVAFLFVLAGSAVAACTADVTSAGPKAPPVEVTPDKGDAGGGEAASPEAAAPEPSGPMNPIVASTLAADLKAAGIDLSAPPSLDDIKADKTKLMAVMKSFTKSLGVTCDGCHAKGADGKMDFAKSTEDKNIAEGMWKHFVGELAAQDGTALYCDSCHQGNKLVLNRTDDKAIADWMKANFIGKLKPRDGSSLTCTTCHGQPFDSSFLDKWGSGGF